MSKLRCLCSELLDLNLIPNPQAFIVVADTAIEDIVQDQIQICNDATIGQETRNDRLFFSLLSMRNKGVAEGVECPQCGRIAIFGRPGNDPPDVWYKVEKRREPNL